MKKLTIVSVILAVLNLILAVRLLFMAVDTYYNNTFKSAYKKGLFEWEQGNREKACGFFKKSLSARPSFIAPAVFLAQHSITNPEYDFYIEKLEKSDNYFFQAAALNIRGVAAFKKNDQPTAEKHFTEALEKFKSGDACVNLGMMYLSLAKREKAEEFLRKALEMEIKPGYHALKNMYYCLGVLSMSQGRAQKAAVNFNKSLAVTGNWKPAKKGVHLAEILHTVQTGMHKNLSRLLYILRESRKDLPGNVFESIVNTAAVRTVKKEGPISKKAGSLLELGSSPVNRFNLAAYKLFYNNGFRDPDTRAEALVILDRLSKDKNTPGHLTSRIQEIMGFMKFADGDNAATVTHLSAAREKGKLSPQSLTSLGIALYRLNRFDEAEKVIGQVRGNEALKQVFNAFTKNPDILNVFPAHKQIVRTPFQIQCDVRFNSVATLPEAKNITIALDGKPRKVTVSGSRAVSGIVAGFMNGEHTIEILASDPLGNKTREVREFLADNSPPVCIFTKPTGNSRVSQDRPEITIMVKDKLSGIDIGSCEVSLESHKNNSKTFMMRAVRHGRYDIGKNKYAKILPEKITFAPPFPLENGGRFIIRVSVRDKAGNLNEAQSQFEKAGASR